MGCGSSKVAVVPTAEGCMVGDNGKKAPSTCPAVKVQGADSSDPSCEDISISARTSNGLAFEVPLHDNTDDESLIKKHPPRRLQRLEEQQVTQLTHHLLQEKQAEAEQRRLQILSQRVASAKARQKLKRNHLENGEIKHNGLMIESMNQEPTSVAL